MRATTMWLAAGALLAGAAQAQTLPGTALGDPGKMAPSAAAQGWDDLGDSGQPSQAETDAAMNSMMGDGIKMMDHAAFVRCIGHMERTAMLAVLGRQATKKDVITRLEALSCRGKATVQLLGTSLSPQWYEIAELYDAAIETKSASAYATFVATAHRFLAANRGKL